MTTNCTTQRTRICPDCKGNGFIWLRLEAEEATKNCETCHSHGEITKKEFDDYWNRPKIAKISGSMPSY